MAVEKGTFAKNEALINAAERAKAGTGRLHFLGLVSDDNDFVLTRFVFMLWATLVCCKALSKWPSDGRYFV